MICILILIPIHLKPVAGLIASILIWGPMAVGWAIFSLSISMKHNDRIEQLFAGFNKFGIGEGAYLHQILSRRNL